MANVLIDDGKLTAVANAIRSKTGRNVTMTVSEMAREIASINTTDEWARPGTWPDYAALDLTNQEVVYFTVDTNLVDDPYIYIEVSGSNFTLEKGNIYGNTFISSTIIANVGSEGVSLEWYFDRLSSQDYEDVVDENGYVVYRLQGNLTCVTTRLGTYVSGTSYPSTNQPIIEIYGRLPNVTIFSFFNLLYLKSITILDLSSLTDLSTGFCQCYSLEYVKLINASGVSDLHDCFSNDHKLKNVIIKGLSTLNSLNSTFFSCINLTSIDLDNYNLQSVISTNSMFNGCYNLKNVNAILDFSGSTSANTVFYNCKSLDFGALNIIGFKNATTFPSIFSGSSIQTFNSNTWDFSNVTSVISFFYNCWNLQNVDMSQADFSNVTNTSTMFYECKNVKIIKLPATLQIIGNQMFLDCTSLEELHIAATTPPSVSLPTAWTGLASSCKIYVPYSADHSILNAYKNATNYSNVASRIFEEPSA